MSSAASAAPGRAQRARAPAAELAGAALSAGARLILTVGGAIIFGYGGYLVYRDQFLAPVADGMTVGMLIIFMDYARKLWEPLKWLTEFVAKVRIFDAAAPARVPRARRPGARSPRRRARISLPVRPRTLALDRCRLWLSRRAGRAARPLGRDPAGRVRRLHRPERHRQEHASGAHAALLRPDRGRAAPRRRRLPRRPSRRRPRAHGARRAGQHHPAGDGPREHRLWPAGREPGRDRRGGAARRRRGVHRGSAGRLRDRAGGGRAEPLRRPAPAHRHRPGAAERGRRS